MWANAAEWLNKFDEAVLTALDADGYPVSVRVSSASYDAATGELPAYLPSELRPVESPANLLGHYHDEKMWHITAIAIKGHLVKRDDAWIFTTERFDAPSKFAVLSFIKSGRASAQRYLERRGLSRPEVNWAAVKEIQRRAKT